MTITTYNIKQSFIFTSDNRLSYEAFNYILAHSEQATIDGVIINSEVDNFKISLRIPEASIWNAKWNFIQIKDDTNTVYYTVNNAILVEDANPQAVDVNCSIDLYYSYMINLFSETNNNNQTPIFFKQKHCNRFYYIPYENKQLESVYYSKQFYLLIKHPELENIKATHKYTYIPSVDMYNTRLNANITNCAMLSSTYPGYVYALVKIGANQFNATYANNPLQSFLLGLININNNPVNNQYTNNNAFTMTSNGYYSSVAWWWLTTYSGADEYEDYIVLPITVEIALVETSETNYEQLKPTLMTYIGTLSKSAPTEDWKNLIAYSCNPQHLYYLYNANTLNNEITTMLNVACGAEPYIMNYYGFRVRSCGEDSFVDLTAFDQCSSYAYLTSLFSYVINMNHPVTQITNIPYNKLVNIFNQWGNSADTPNTILIPWKYNQLTDPIWSINWKAIYPSASNNWSNYLLNNLNQYHTALNIAHYAVQSSFANAVLGGISSGINLTRSGMSFVPEELDDFGYGMSDRFNNSIGSLNFLDEATNNTNNLVNNVFSYLQQKQEYNYLKYGKQQDLSRIANLRLATNNNAIAYNDFVLSFVLETPLISEIYTICNYIELNGYIVDRWLPFYYWLNRKYVNYFKAAYLSDMLIPSLIKPYKQAIDKICNFGFRIWTLAAINDGYINDTLNLNPFLYNYGNYVNVELNINNDEVNFMNGLMA